MSNVTSSSGTSLKLQYTDRYGNLQNLPVPLAVSPRLFPTPYPNTAERVMFQDDFNRNKIFPWHYFDGAPNSIWIDNQMSMPPGRKALCLLAGLSVTNQDMSIVLPAPSGVVGLSCWFTYLSSIANPGIQGSLLLSIEKRKAVGNNQMQEMWFHYDFPSGTAKISANQSADSTTLNTFNPILSGVNYAESPPTGEPVPEAGVGATDRASVNWHYFKAIADIKNGIYKRFLIDDWDSGDLSTYGTAQWYEPVGHTLLSGQSMTRFEIHNIGVGDLVHGQTYLWVANLQITDES